MPRNARSTMRRNANTAFHERRASELPRWHRVKIGLRLADRRLRQGGFTPVPAKPRLSTRGQHHPSYFTKRHTPARLREMREDQERRLNG